MLLFPLFKAILLWAVVFLSFKIIYLLLFLGGGGVGEDFATWDISAIFWN
jgi:hypothetical protein